MRDHQDPRPLHTIGAAVIGTGFIGTVHVEALRRLGVTVHGILGSTPERGARRAIQLGIPRAYRSLDELLDDPHVEVVHVASPNHLHHPQASAVLAAGRHVICEKPLGLTSRETAELLALAQRSGRVHAVNFNIRFYPLNQHVRALVADGELGEVRLVSGHYLQDWLLLDTDWNWRLEPERGGPLRAVADIGSHWLDLVGFLIGRRVEEVVADLATVVPVRQEPTGPVETFASAAGATRPRRMETDDLATILLRFAGGVRGALVVSQVSPGRKNALRYEIDGSRAAACWESERPDELWIGHRQRANEILLRTPALMAPPAAATAALPGGHAEGFADTFKALYRAVYSAVAAGEPPADPPYPTFADGHEEVLIGEAIAESARTGRWVPVRRETADAPGR